jgi:DNA-3-methyladenine glycosylase II
MAELPRMDAYGALVFQIVGQQLSVRATRAILARLEALFGGRLPEPQEILDARRRSPRSLASVLGRCTAF